jgi:hypothetical protein
MIRRRINRKKIPAAILSPPEKSSIKKYNIWKRKEQPDHEDHH